MRRLRIVFLKVSAPHRGAGLCPGLVTPNPECCPVHSHLSWALRSGRHSEEPGRKGCDPTPSHSANCSQTQGRGQHLGGGVFLRPPHCGACAVGPHDPHECLPPGPRALCRPSWSHSTPGLEPLSAGPPEGLSSHPSICVRPPQTL